MALSRARRATLVTLLVLVAIAATGTAYLYDDLGRTPGELIRHAERRLQGHPNLQRVAVPLLDGLRAWLGEPGYGELPSPFPVPALPANVAQMPPPPVHVPAQADTAHGSGRIVRVGPRRDVVTIAKAAQIAQDGDVIEIDGGDYRGDVAVWDRAAVTLRGVGGRVRLIAAGADAEGKAIWVIRRGRIVVENIDFVGARVADRNGAGIRFEQGHLVIRNCLFFNNENGLLASGGDAQLEIENSEFAYNGGGDGLTHQLYAGNLRSLKVSGSYFHHANAGHLIKSRAAHNDIRYNRLTDESGGRASYELEFPNGGVARVVGNIIQQTAGGGNSTLISYGAEGYAWPLNTLELAHNTLVNDEHRGGAFLRVAPGAQIVRTRNNLLVGRGRYHTPAVRDASGDVNADWHIFAAAARHDYRLNAAGRKLAAVPQASELMPRSEYVHTRQLRMLSATAAFPGAVQTPGPD